MNFIKRQIFVLIAFVLGLTIGCLTKIYIPSENNTIKASYRTFNAVPIISEEDAVIKDHAKYCPVTPVEK